MQTDEDESVDYGSDELDELAHAYAVTIHHSRGSQIPAVVIPLTTSLVDDAAAQPALHRGDPGQEAGRARQLRRALAAAVRTRGARPPPHRPGPPPATRQLAPRDRERGT